VNPHNGDPQWGVPFRAEYGISVATPVWGAGNLLFVSAEYGAGTKVIRVERSGNQTNAKEVWASNPAEAAPRERDTGGQYDVLHQRRQRQPGDPERS